MVRCTSTTTLFPYTTLFRSYIAGRYSELVAAAKGVSTSESFYWRSRGYNELALQAFAQLGELPPSVELHQLKDRKSTRLNSSHVAISYAVFCLKKKKIQSHN